LIYKYRINGEPISLPANSRVLTAAYQGDDMYVWVELGTNTEITYEFYYVGTGWNENTSNDIYVATLVSKEGFVWHIFYKELE
jgi:hypothetical protein